MRRLFVNKHLPNFDKKILALFLVCLSISTLTGFELINVLAAPSPTINRTNTPGAIGPCTWFISLDGTTPIAMAMVGGLSVSPGDNIVGTAGQDVAAFLNTNILAANQEVCFSGQNFGLSTQLLVYSDEVFKGISTRNTILTYTGSAAEAVKPALPSQQNFRFAFKQMSLVVTQQNVGGFDLTTFSFSVFEDCYIASGAGGTLSSQTLRIGVLYSEGGQNSAYFNAINRCDIQNWYKGVENNLGNVNTVTNTRFQSNYISYNIESGVDNTVISSDFEGNVFGYRIGGSNLHNIIISCHFELNSNNDVVIPGTNSTVDAYGLAQTPAITVFLGTGSLLRSNLKGAWTTPAPTTITAGASPWTYTNNDGYTEILTLTTANGITGLTYRGDAGYPITKYGFPFILDPRQYQGGPGESIIVTWVTSAPVFIKYPMGNGNN